MTGGSRLTATLAVAFSVLLLGATIGLGVAFVDSKPEAWLGPAATVTAASSAALVALRLNESAGERRAAVLAQQQRELRAAQQNRYERLLQTILTQFGGTPADETARRSELAAWGSSDLLNLMNRWFAFARDITQNGGVVPIASRPEIQALVADIALLARNLSGVDDKTNAPSQNTMGQLLFDDWSSANPAAPELGHDTLRD
ncbi:hypothetical protein [Frigoribacterium sp. Leaf8]|uniref:hypothetical protein n=1 Tax=Frigoribacterium sp. Leaf8 TaxID=1735673 RepID=UPI0012FC68E1|nr:hypothetical protein [Frigoribacterium sp. Leaf8]